MQYYETWNGDFLPGGMRKCNTLDSCFPVTWLWQILWLITTFCICKVPCLKNLSLSYWYIKHQSVRDESFHHDECLAYKMSCSYSFVSFLQTDTFTTKWTHPTGPRRSRMEVCPLQVMDELLRPRVHFASALQPYHQSQGHLLLHEDLKELHAVPLLPEWPQTFW